jgi:hypothetical protein
MRRTGLLISAPVVGMFLMVFAVSAQVPSSPQATATPGATLRPAPDPPHQRNGEVGWHLMPSEQRYASIDGARLKQYVADQTAIARRYRDQGHQFWGRIIGTSADQENAQWLMDKLKQFGLSDVHEIPIDLQPQWMPQSWSVVASVNQATLNLETAQPT